MMDSGMTSNLKASGGVGIVARLIPKESFTVENIRVAEVLGLGLDLGLGLGVGLRLGLGSGLEFGREEESFTAGTMCCRGSRYM